MHEISGEEIQRQAIECQKYLNYYVYREAGTEFEHRQKDVIDMLNGLLEDSYLGETLYCSGSMFLSLTGVDEHSPNELIRKTSVLTTDVDGEASHFVAIDIDKDILPTAEESRKLINSIRKASGRIAVCNTIILERKRIKIEEPPAVYNVTDRVAAPISTNFIFFPDTSTEKEKRLTSGFDSLMQVMSPTDVGRCKEIKYLFEKASSPIEGVIECSASFNELCIGKTDFEIEVLLHYVREITSDSLGQLMIGFSDLPQILRLNTSSNVTPLNLEEKLVVVKVEKINRYPNYLVAIKETDINSGNPNFSLHVIGRLCTGEHAQTHVAIPLENLTKDNVDSVR